MKLVITILVAWGLISHVVCQEVSPVALQSLVDAALRRSNAPGAIVGIYRPQLPPIIVTGGWADVEQKRRMTSADHFRIASISKLFVATAILTLADEGKLSVDDPVSKYLAGVPNGDRITLRHLANHRSGLFNHIESREVKDKFSREPQRWWKQEELLAMSLQQPVYYEPGAAHHYSNANTILLAKVLTQVTGQPWQQVVEERVIKPLGLKQTSISRDNQMPAPFIRGYALGTTAGVFFHRGDLLQEVTTTSPSWWDAAGNIISTLDDLGKAAKPLTTGALLKETGRRALHAWTATDAPATQYGFHIEKMEDMLGHDGDVPGYQTYLFYLPEHDTTVVAMMNLYGWSIRGMPADDLARQVIKLVFPKPYDSPARVRHVEEGLKPFAESRYDRKVYSLPERMKYYGVPGVSLAVIQDGRVVWRGNYGLNEVHQSEVVKSETMFQASSLSKFVTAAAVLRLVDAGKLDLDRDINAYLKNWKLRREDQWKDKPVTLRQLLSHTAGVSPRGYLGYLAGAQLPTLQQILDGQSPANSGAVKIVSEPGAGQNYSGGGYQIIQQVVEEVCQNTLERVVQEQVFQPLGMKHSSFVQPLDHNFHVVRASGHDQGTPVPGRWFTYPEQAAAGLWSTSEDIARLMIELRRCSRGESSYLSKAITAEMLTPIKLADGKTGEYGLGPELEGNQSTKRLGHTGGTIGYRSVLTLFLETGQGAVIMTNGNGGDALAGEILRSLASEYDWPGTAYETRSLAVLKMDEKQLSGYAGNYAIDGNGTPVTLKVQGSGLRLETRYKAPLEFLPVSESVFSGISSERELEFHRDAAGKVNSAFVKYQGKILFNIHRRN